MAYEIYRTGATVSGQSASVRANYNVSTGGQAVGQAIAGAGSVLQQLGEKWDLQEADTQFTKAKSLARQEHNNFLIASRELEPENFQKAYAASMKLRQSFMPKNRRAAGVYGNWLTSIEPYFAEDKNNRMIAKIEDNGRMGVFNSLEEFVSMGQGDGFVNLAKGVAHGWYSKEEAAKIKQRTLEDRDRHIKSQDIQARAKQADDREKYIEATGDTWLDNFRNDALTENMILNNKFVPVAMKTQWLARLDKRNADILEGKTKKTEVTHKMQGRQMALDMRQGTISPAEFKDWQANALAGGMEDADYEEITELAQREFRAGQIETIQGRITANKSQLVDIPSELSLPERLRGLSESAKEDVLSLRKLQLDNWDRYSRELTNYQKEHPEATIDELYNYGQQLLSQYKRSPDELRDKIKLRTATQKHGQEELKKAKEALEGAKDQRVEYLRLAFNLSPEEITSVEELLKKGVSIGDITKHLQGKAK